MRKVLRSPLLVALLLLPAARAAVTLPRLISDHMMLQQGVPVRIWGKANPGEGVTVRFQGQTASARATADGKWETHLGPLRAGGPAELRIEADNSITVHDVLVGEVWIGSGQSNMVWPVERSNHPDEESAAANSPQIRLFKVTLKTSDVPLDEVEGQWQACSPETVKSFSAVGYFFARHLHQKLRMPVGVIQSAWGGTPAEAWTSMEALSANPALRFYLENWDRVMSDYPAEKARFDRSVTAWEEAAKAARTGGEEPKPKPAPPRGPGHPHAPASLYNAMIAPLVPYAIRGAIWYQGETNAGANQAYLYRYLFQTMILDWRSRWAQGDFPFLFVQLANYAKTAQPSGWPELRESQRRALDLRNTGMAVITDIGEAGDIHPRNKQDVGLRLALAARALVYGEKLTYSGPLFRQMTKEGNCLRLWFDHASGLAARGGGELRGFTVAGLDRVFHPARAVIEKDSVVVSAEAVTDPLAARYAWADDPENNLVNSEGLPASPFRTDDWRNARMP